MDHSSLAEAQQQQHQQHQQHQQQQSDQQQAYDPAQAQAYAAYYAAYDQYYAASAYYHQPYYPHDYSSSSTAASAGAYYTEAPPDSAAPQADAAQIHHSGSHGTEKDGYSYHQAQAGLNPAAVAALSQISQLTGSIDAAERMMAAGMHSRPQSSHYPQYSHPMAMQHGAPSIRPGVGDLAHRGGGRRGGGPLRGRGGNRGRIGQRPSGRDGGGPPPSSRGRGHGRMSRGRGRRPQHFAPELRQTAIAPTLEPSISAAAYAQGRPSFTPKAPQKSLLPVAWCDICRVDCNSLEILEQHKNGKRHKRTVQRVQEIQAQQKVISADWQFNTAAKPDLFIQGEDGYKVTNDGQGSTYATNRAVPSSAGGTEAGKGSAASAHVGEVKKDVASSAQEPVVEESIEGFVASENNQQEMEIGNQCPLPEGQSDPVSDSANTGGLLPDASQDETLPMDGLSKKRRMACYDRNDRWRGSKQKMMRISRGGKHFKGFERTHNRPFERPKDRPRERPRVCTVCNVMCDTMAVFECHLTGKKHISRIKRFEGHGSVYGPISVYIPPNQPTANPNKGPEPLFYGLQSYETLQQEAALSHEMLQQGAHGVDSQQMETLAVEQCYQVEGLEEAEGAVPEFEVKQTLGHQEEVGSVNDAIDDEQVVVMPNPDGQNSLDDPNVSETKKSAPDDIDLVDSTFLPVVILPEYGTSIGAEVGVPGLNATSEEPLANSE